MTTEQRNYRLLVAEGITFTVGMVFFDPNTVLPLLMERLTASALLVGIMGAVQPAIKGVVSTLAGNYISSLPRKKTYLVVTMSSGRLPLWILGGILISVSAAPTWLWAALLLAIQAMFWFGDAAGDPAWMDMVGKAVAPTRRGGFFATRQVIGGLLSVPAGVLVAAIITRGWFSFPANYGVVVLVGALIYLANVATFVGLTETPSPTTERVRLRSLVGRLPDFLRSNPRYARTMLVLILFNMMRLSLPFFIVFGRRSLGIAEAALAVVIPLQLVGRMLGAVTWGLIGDRFGHYRAIRGVTALSVVPAIVGVLLVTFGSPGTVTSAVFALLFFVLGFSLEGWPPFINHMIDIVTPEDRPRYAGLLGLASIPAALAPVAGGLIINLWGYGALFSATIVLTFCGFLLALTLRR